MSSTTHPDPSNGVVVQNMAGKTVTLRDGGRSGMGSATGAFDFSLQKTNFSLQKTNTKLKWLCAVLGLLIFVLLVVLLAGGNCSDKTNCGSGALLVAGCLLLAVAGCCICIYIYICFW
jgi:hypothetical protein